MAKKTELNVELRKVSPQQRLHLSKLLDIGDGWKELMSVVTLPGDNKLKFSSEDIKIIEVDADLMKRSYTDVLLEEWGCSGKILPKLSTLLEMLIKAELFEAAEYVANLLNYDPPERPLSGPSSCGEIPDINKFPLIKPIPSAPPLLSNNSFNSFNNNSNNNSSDNNASLQNTLINNIGSTILNNSVTPIALSGALETMQIEERELINETVLSFDYEQLKNLCDNFDERKKLGNGAFGEVYLCSLPKLGKVAVKRIFSCNDSPADPLQQFKNEILTLSQLTHSNLLPLVGYSINSSTPCLIYNYMPNGSLQDRLECKDETEVISWQLRLDIALGTALGLQYLHNREPKALVHRDVKSANILLDEEMKPKLGDFGLARLGNFNKTIVTNTIQGTTAYMAIEALRGNISVKQDVFSFGVVLLELITGLPPLDENRVEGIDLISYVEELTDEIDDDMKRVVEIVRDKRLVNSQNIIEKLYRISKECLVEKKLRLDIDQVINRLI